jgi:hypothetical protein
MLEANVIIDLIFKDNWNSALARKKFFENFAKEHNFDPLVPANWRMKYDQLSAEKVCSIQPTP